VEIRYPASSADCSLNRCYREILGKRSLMVSGNTALPLINFKTQAVRG
jgi:hypothetical protein